MTLCRQVEDSADVMLVEDCSHCSGIPDIAFDEDQIGFVQQVLERLYMSAVSEGVKGNYLGRTISFKQVADKI